MEAVADVEAGCEEEGGEPSTTLQLVLLGDSGSKVVSSFLKIRYSDHLQLHSR